MHDEIGMMISFGRMSEAFINCLHRDEARARVPNKGSQNATTGRVRFHREPNKGKFLEFLGATENTTTKAWLENMAMCLALHDYTSNMKVCMVVFQLKGERSFMVEDDPTTNEYGRRRGVMGTIEERFWERYLSEEFIESQLNEFNTLQKGSHTFPEYEAQFL
jgi:hypothetical protein